MLEVHDDAKPGPIQFEWSTRVYHTKNTFTGYKHAMVLEMRKVIPWRFHFMINYKQAQKLRRGGLLLPLEDLQHCTCDYLHPQVQAAGDKCMTCDPYPDGAAILRRDGLPTSESPGHDDIARRNQKDADKDDMPSGEIR